MTDVGVGSAPTIAASTVRRSWFDALVETVDRLPGQTVVFVLVATVVLAIPAHMAEFIDRPGAFIIHPDLVIGAATPPIFLWLAVWLNDIAGKALARLRPALDPGGPSEAAIAADLTRTPNVLAVPALVIGVLGGLASVLQAPQNWGIDPQHPGARQVGAFAISVVTDVVLAGLLAHVLHQLRVVTQVHRRAQIDLFQLEPLYAFSALTARTGIALLALVAGIIAFLSLSIGTFLLVGSSDFALTGVIVAIAIACFFVPLLGLHGRIADVKAEHLGAAQATLSVVIDAVRARVAAGDLEGAAKIKDAMLAADSSVIAISRISTWPWRTETLRGFVSAVLLPIGLFVVYELLRRLLQ